MSSFFRSYDHLFCWLSFSFTRPWIIQMQKSHYFYFPPKPNKVPGIWKAVCGVLGLAHAGFRELTVRFSGTIQAVVFQTWSLEIGPGGSIYTLWSIRHGKGYSPKERASKHLLPYHQKAVCKWWVNKEWPNGNSVAHGTLQ